MFDYGPMPAVFVLFWVWFLVKLVSRGRAGKNGPATSTAAPSHVTHEPVTASEVQAGPVMRWSLLAAFITLLVGIPLALIYPPAILMWIAAFALLFIFTTYVIPQQEAARRRQGLTALASRLGLQFSDVDPFDLPKLSFTLFTKAHTQRAPDVDHAPVSVGARSLRVDHVLSGRYGTLPIIVFEAHMPAHVFGIGVSGAIAPVALDGPPLVIERKNVGFALTSQIGLPDVVDLEPNEFADAFTVRCGDRRFASSVLDPSLMGWLLDTPDNTSFEIVGGSVLCYGELREPARIEALIGSLREFIARIPTVATALYPRDAERPAAAATAAPITVEGVAGSIVNAGLQGIGIAALAVWAVVGLFLAFMAIAMWQMAQNGTWL